MDSLKGENEGFIHRNAVFVQPKGIKEAASPKKSLSVSGLVFAVAGLASEQPKSRISIKAETKIHSTDISITDSRREKSVLELIKYDIKQHRREINAVLLILFAASAFIFYNYMKAGIVLLSLTAMGAVSRSWQRFFPLEFGIELVMLATVISGVVYGALAGAAVGFLSLVLSTLLTQEDPGKMWPAFGTIVLIGFFAGTLTIANIALWGVLFTVAYDAIITVIYIAMGFSPIKTLIFDATHIAFNYFVFYSVAPLILSFIA